MATSPSCARSRVAPPSPSADQLSAQTRNGAPWAPARPSAARLVRLAAWKRPPAVSVTAKWAMYSWRVAHAEARGSSAGDSATRKNVSWKPT